MTGSYLVGAIICMIAEYVGMRFAFISNARTVKKARKSMEKGFKLAFMGGCGAGFSVTGLAVIGLTIMLGLYKSWMITKTSNADEYDRLFMGLTGFAFGASIVSIFGRLGGGIFTKAADVGADLAGKAAKLEEDDFRNPGVIADFVGDNVGDVGGSGSAYFAGVTECSCAALLLSCNGIELLQSPLAIYFPILALACAIPVSIISVWVTSTLTYADSRENVGRLLKNQTFTASVIMTPILLLISYICLPDEIHFITHGFVSSKYQVFVCVFFGMWSGYLIGMSSEFFTSNDYYPVQEVAKSCHTGSATDIIYGLALGYMSTLFPILIMVAMIYISYICAGLYGIAMATIGILTSVPLGLSISCYGAIADNASGIASMCKIELAKSNTAALHAGTKVAAAHSRCYAVCGASMIALSLFAAFVNRHHILLVDVLQPIEFAGLIIGAMLPYAFSSQILKSVCDAAGEVEKEINSQLPKIMPEGNRKNIDYQNCVKICTIASEKALIIPTIIVLVVPLVAGILFGPLGLCGLLAGIIISGVQMGVSFVNSGVAWDNAMKYIEGTIISL